MALSSFSILKSLPSGIGGWGLWTSGTVSYLTTYSNKQFNKCLLNKKTDRMKELERLGPQVFGFLQFVENEVLEDRGGKG